MINGLLLGFGALIGVYLSWCGVTAATHRPYKWIYARASILWGRSAHLFLAVSGVLIFIAMLIFLELSLI